MQIGAMNHPSQPVLREIAWIGELGFDFVDLTLEPPAAATWQIRPREIRAALEEHGMGVVGHTAYYLPIASSFESLRTAAVAELKRAADAFAEIGAKWMNVHPDGHAPFVDESTIVRRNIKSLAELSTYARERGVGIMLENVPGRFNTVAQLEPLMDGVPDLGLHLDIGHSNLAVEQNTAGELVQRFSQRLAHVHLHDNRGGQADLHLALGMGNLDVSQHLDELCAGNYDGTITLEVFSRDRHFLTYSRDQLRAGWARARDAVEQHRPKAIPGV